MQNMGLLDRYKSDLAEQARQQAAAAEAVRRLARNAEKARLDDLTRQEREAAEINFKQVAEFLPLLKALSARKELQDLVRLWGMGRVDKVPQYVPDGNYASLTWRKRYWNHEVVGTEVSEQDGQSNIYGHVVRTLSFEVQVRKDPSISFTTCLKNDGDSPYRGYGGTTGWQEFSLDDPKRARTLLVETMLGSINHLVHPREMIKQSYPMPYYSIECGPSSTPSYPKTPIRHPFLISLGFPDFDIPIQR